MLSRPLLHTLPSDELIALNKHSIPNPEPTGPTSLQHHNLLPKAKARQARDE